jgi:hypothetical protein
MRILICLFVAIPALAIRADERTAEPSERLMVPAYFYPAGAGLGEWEKLFRSAARPAVVAIVNPASGPGRTADPNYTAIVKRAAHAKVTLIGYITTSYAKRPIADVKADIDLWLRLYPGIRGIFFDEQASDASHVDYQASLYSYVRNEKKLDLVVTNPGTTCAEGYLARPAADVVCLFEGPWDRNRFMLPSWSPKYAPNRIAVLPNAVATANAMRRCVETTRTLGVGWIDVTDTEGNRRWERLPRYWDEESQAVREMNGARGPK